MKKYLIILLSILSACCAIRKQETSISINQIKNDFEIKKTELKVSDYQINSYLSLKSYKGDTLGYVQHNFISNKQKYIGMDLNHLLKDLEIPIESYINGTTDKNYTISKDIILQFYSLIENRKLRYNSRKPVNIIVVWAQPLAIDRADILLVKNKGLWTEDERQFYGKQIIGDIMTTDWGK